MKRRIAFISEHASPLAALGGVDNGGQNVYVGELSKHLALLGYEVDIFTRWDDERLPQIIEFSKNVRVIHIEAGPVQFIKKENLLPYMKDFKKNMVSFLKTNSYNLIHANFWMSAMVGLEIKKEFGIPLVVTFHALGKVRKKYQGKNDLFPEERTYIEGEIVKQADQIIAECPQDKEDLINLYGATNNSITIIPPGFNPHELFPIDKLLARSVLKLDYKEKIILHVGRIVARKGIDNLIKATSKLIKTFQEPVRLIIVGGESELANPQLTPEIGKLQHLAEAQKIKDNILFVGRKSREKLKYFYSASDIFVTTPWYEPFGITPLEAMACGLPVIGSRVGGIKYSVIDGKTGYLVKADDSEKLAQKIKEIFQNGKLQLYFRNNAIQRVNSLFTWTKIANAVANLYEEIMFKTRSSLEESFLIIEKSFDCAIETFRKSRESLRIPVLDAATAIARCLIQDGKVFICGNGGSAADADHFSAELIGRYLNYTRPGLPVFSLTSNPSVITALANDIDFENVFSRQIEAYGESGDVLVGITTSGQSKNIIKAFREAREKNILCIGLLGKTGGEILTLSDIAILVPSYDTPRIQEVHSNIIHTITEIIEKLLFTNKDHDLIADELKELLTIKVKNHFLRAIKIA